MENDSYKTNGNVEGNDYSTLRKGIAAIATVATLGALSFGLEGCVSYDAAKTQRVTQSARDMGKGIVEMVRDAQKGLVNLTENFAGKRVVWEDVTEQNLNIWAANPNGVLVYGVADGVKLIDFRDDVEVSGQYGSLKGGPFVKAEFTTGNLYALKDGDEIIADAYVSGGKILDCYLKPKTEIHGRTLICYDQPLARDRDENVAGGNERDGSGGGGGGANGGHPIHDGGDGARAR